MPLVRGDTVPAACSVGLEPVLNDRADYRSAVGGGVHAGAPAATESDAHQQADGWLSRRPLRRDDAQEVIQGNRA